MYARYAGPRKFDERVQQTGNRTVQIDLFLPDLRTVLGERSRASQASVHHVHHCLASVSDLSLLDMLLPGVELLRGRDAMRTAAGRQDPDGLRCAQSGQLSSVSARCESSEMQMVV